MSEVERQDYENFLRGQVRLWFTRRHGCDYNYDFCRLKVQEAVHHCRAFKHYRDA